MSDVMKDAPGAALNDGARLIINRRSETVRVGRPGVLCLGGLVGEIVALPDGRFRYDLALSRLELAALALQVADAAGLICELRQRDPSHR